MGQESANFKSYKFMRCPSLLHFAYLLLLFIYSPTLAASIPEAVTLVDHTRQRAIPIEIYRSLETVPPKQLVIISHGYGVKNTEYSFLANHLALLGYNVVSIQHDLPTDAPLPKTGSLYERRKPLWERGVANILFTIQELQKMKLHKNEEKIILIGHSNGGDISMLFATQYPEKLSHAVSLDSLRMPFPPIDQPKVLSLRAVDSKADNGVIPSQVLQEKIGMKVLRIANAKHIDFCDRGPTQIKHVIQETITAFLAGK